MNRADLRRKAATLPLLPGVYIMSDKSGKVIYVGKAKALKNRVSQYFGSDSNHTPKTVAMVSQVHDFDTIVAASEFEALVLECSLIKRHQPKYNILLKDGKGYPFIRVSSGAFPQFSLAGRRDGDGARYFGPYGGRTVAAQVIRALTDALKLPSCDRVFPRDIGRDRPCLQHHLGRCVAPCTGKVSAAEFAELIDQAALLMEGKHIKLLSDLERQMTEAAESLLFEKAAALRDRREAVANLSRRQRVVAAGMADTDVLGFYAGTGDKSAIAVLHFLDGELFNREIHVFPDSEEDIIAGFLKQYYTRDLPKTILIPVELEDVELIENLLKKNTGKSAKIRNPKRGDDLSRVNLANLNAREELERRTTREERQSKLTRELSKMLGFEDRMISRIEAYDISNTGDQNRVGAMTVFIDGEPRKKDYKLFTVKDASINDDFNAMREVLTRRYRRYLDGDKNFGERPDALFIDGGAVHADIVRRAIAELGDATLGSLPVFGMVKDDRHRTRALVTPQNEEIGISQIPALFAMVGKIQEETHRFAITFHRSKRDKAVSELDGIPGLGKERIKKLREHFQTHKAIKAASVDELCAVLPKSVAQAVYDKLRGIEK